MSLVVQKYGGSSVADLERIRLVARRVQRYFEEGHRVVVSAMGKTTDTLLSMASQLHSFPPEREVDMLLSTGEQVSIALLSLALFALGVPSISLTGGRLVSSRPRSTRKPAFSVSRLEGFFSIFRMGK